MPTILLWLPNGYDTVVGEEAKNYPVVNASASALHAPFKILKFYFRRGNIRFRFCFRKTCSNALENIMKDRTTIMIAHRLSTIRNADEIYVIHQGHNRRKTTTNYITEIVTIGNYATCKLISNSKKKYFTPLYLLVCLRF